MNKNSIDSILVQDLVSAFEELAEQIGCILLHTNIVAISCLHFLDLHNYNLQDTKGKSV